MRRTSPVSVDLPKRSLDVDGVRQDLSEKSLDQGRNFLSALFMAVRTAQIHDPGNKAFIHAVDMVHRSAETLFASSGGFSVQFVEDVAFLNGIRLRFESSAFAAVRTLRRIFEQHELGGITMRTPPSRQAIHRLILLFAASNTGPQAVSKEDFTDLDIGLLGVQHFSDGASNVQVDRRVFAVQCYAKLILAVREQVERLRIAAASNWQDSVKPPRLRAVRVIQDLVELCGDRADFLLRLSTNRSGAQLVELSGANACVLSIATGYAVGFERQSLVDIGVAALFHHLDAGIGRPIPADATGAPTAIAQLLSDGGVGRSSYTRAFVVAERPTLDAPHARTSEAHPFARLLGVTVAYGQLTTGFGRPIDPETGRRAAAIHPLDALAELHNDPERFDRRMVDVLINVLRAFPSGVDVVLDDGQRARVLSHVGGSRWDRPVVQVNEGGEIHNLDLMVRREGRFERRIVGTRMFVEVGAPRDRELPVANIPAIAQIGSLAHDESVELTPVPDTRSTFDDLNLELPPLEDGVTQPDPFERNDPFDEAIRNLRPASDDDL